MSTRTAHRIRDERRRTPSKYDLFLAVLPVPLLLGFVGAAATSAPLSTGAGLGSSTDPPPPPTTTTASPLAATTTTTPDRMPDRGVVGRRRRDMEATSGPRARTKVRRNREE
jgi:hypothetical protein